MRRVVVARTRAHLAAELERRLDGLDLLALFGDGVVVAGRTVIVALGVTQGAAEAERSAATAVPGGMIRGRLGREPASSRRRDTLPVSLN